MMQHLEYIQEIILELIINAKCGDNFLCHNLFIYVKIISNVIF
jgi:hypothetical protein